MNNAGARNGSRVDIQSVILDEAAFWLMELHSGQLDSSKRQKLNEWRARSADHERAWQRSQAFSTQLQGLSPAGARVLKQLASSDRRKAVKTITALLVAAPAGWLGYHYAFEGEGVRYNTAVGQQREIVLHDGSRVLLNTNTKIDVVFSADQRRLILRQGEILVTTAKDNHSYPRPFSVQVKQGSMRALGTRFTARQDDAKSHVAVMDGAVEVTPVDNAAAKTIVSTNTLSSFTSREADTPVALDAGAGSWADGMLVADKMPMAIFLAELDRYRPGKLQYDARVAKLLVSGAFSVKDTDQTLATLEQTMPVRIKYLTRYWVTVMSQ